MTIEHLLLLLKIPADHYSKKKIFFISFWFCESKFCKTEKQNILTFKMYAYD